METARSPSKRVKHSVTSSAAAPAAAVLTTEPALLATIIEFLPVASEEPSSKRSKQANGDDDEHSDAEDDVKANMHLQRQARALKTIGEAEQHKKAELTGGEGYEDDDDEDSDERKRMDCEDDDEESEDEEDVKARVRLQRPAGVLKTIAILCCAIPGLSKLIGPTNEAFWRHMVLAHFDFTTGMWSFNVEDYGNAYCTGLDNMEYVHPRDLDKPNLGEREYYGKRYERWSKHPVKPAMDTWQVEHGDDVPKHLLEESLSHWSSIDAFYRPSQYAFLGEIQRNRTKLATAWPAHEDAFTLFCDLILLHDFALLQRSPDNRRFKARTDGDEDMSVCLLSRLEQEDISDRGFELMEHCGYLPHYWCFHVGNVSSRWSGFDRPLPQGTPKKTDELDNGFATDEERLEFQDAGTLSISLRSIGSCTNPAATGATSTSKAIPKSQVPTFSLARASDRVVGSDLWARVTGE